MGQDLSKRVVKVTLELADGTIENFSIDENAGIICIIVSKAQNCKRIVGYCGSMVDEGLELLKLMLDNVEDLWQKVELQQFLQSHRN